ncbi:tRNA lysidine(34) synthetase TilS [Paenirhodobacter populi]|uniref:tRNA lysidine(34) synthetase TilS n=1 Tax=Paenirhodobacter populi TaxID=2306993 RepID=UPI001F4E5411|nr:tRNA lysidine(34) synthetase TilS [Sinirhodobacter populi]
MTELTTAELTTIVADALGPDTPRRIGVAVSGGGDSTALLHALIGAGFAVEAVTVDHGLRPESLTEAEDVGRVCATLSVPHTILRWPGTEAAGNLMDAARRARLRLIGAWARGQGIETVALGHTADDQAETFLMRLSREAGLEGLSGIRARFRAEGVLWVRPMLTVPRAALRDWLRERDVGWVDDPSNENDRFARVRARKALRALRPAGVTAERIGAVVGHLAAANAALDRLLGQWVAAHVTETGGELQVPEGDFAALDPELRRRFVLDALIWIAGTDYGPRGAKLAAFLAAPRDATLHGCRIRFVRGRMVLSREARAVAGLVAARDAVWDGWQITGPVPGGARIAALEAGGLAQCPDWRATGISRAGLVASPAVWMGETLLAAPLAGVGTGFAARNLRGSFADRGFSR